MSVTRAQFNYVEAAASAGSIAASLTVTAGNLVAVHVKWDVPGGITLSGVQDDLGVNGVLAVTDTEPNDGRGVATYYFKNHGGGARTFTATFSAATTGRAIEVEELAGASTTAPLGQTSHAFGVGTTSSAGSVTPAADGAYISAFVTLSVNGETATSPMVSVVAGTAVSVDSSALEQTTAAAVNPSWTNGTSDNWCAIAAVFLPPATAADTGTAMASIVETDVVTGGKTIVTTLTGDTFAAAAGFENLTFVGDAKNAGLGNASLTVDLSAISMQQGDLVLVAYGVVNTADHVMDVTTTGYTKLFDSFATDTRVANGAVAYKIMGASPDTSVVLTNPGALSSNSFVGIVQVWRGADQTTPIDQTSTQASGANSSVSNSPSITTVTDNALVVSIGVNSGAAADTAVTSPTGYTNQTEHSTDPGTSIRVMMASKIVATAGAEDPAAWGGITTTTSDSWLGFTVALRPAATTPFDSARQARIDGLVSAQSEANGWNAKRSLIPVTAVVRTSDTVMTTTLPAISGYDITAQETITDTIPGSILTSGTPIVASPTFTVDPTSGGGVTLTAGLGQLSLTGFAPSLQQQINAGVGLLTLNGFAPSLNTAILAGLGQLAITGFAASIVNNVVVSAGLGQLVLTGFAADVTAANDITLTAGLGQLALTGFAATVVNNVTLSASLGQISLTGFAPSLDTGVHSGVGQLSLTGFAPSLGTEINAGVGQLAVTGFAPSLDTRINAAVGQLLIAGFAASLGIGNSLVAALGTLDLTGFAPTVDVTNNISLLAGLGQLIIDGYAPTVSGAEISVPPVVAGTGPEGRRGGLLHELRLLQEAEAEEQEAERRGFRDVRITKKRKELQARVALEQRREAAKKAAEIAAENEDEESLVRIILEFLGGE